jgi:hypothetical protein
MILNPLDAAFTLAKEALARFVPDPIKRAEEMRKLEELYQQKDVAELNGRVSLLLKQSEINLADANSTNFWQSGWRPAIGWVGALSLLLMYVPKALVMTAIWTAQCISMLHGADDIANVVLPVFPDLGVTDIIGLLVSMLGIATLRTREKLDRVDTK